MDVLGVVLFPGCVLLGGVEREGSGRGRGSMWVGEGGQLFRVGEVRVREVERGKGDTAT